MNAADDGIIVAQKNHNQFRSGNCMALTTGLFVFGKIGAQEQHVLRYVRDLCLETPADEKARSVLMFAVAGEW